MGNTLEWEGTARGRIVEFGVREVDSGAVGISLVARLSEYYDPDQAAWVDCEQNEYEVSGTTWVTKKDGTPNSKAVESLCQFAGWDGDLMSVADGTWQPAKCTFVIRKSEYKDTIRYEIAFLNDYNRTPGAVGNVSPEKAKALQDRFGPQFRALAGNVQRNAAPPAGKPPVPPSPKKGSLPAALGEGRNALKHVPVEQGIGTGAKIPGNPDADDIPW